MKNIFFALHPFFLNYFSLSLVKKSYWHSLKVTFLSYNALHQPDKPPQYSSLPPELFLLIFLKIFCLDLSHPSLVNLNYFRDLPVFRNRESRI